MLSAAEVRFKKMLRATAALSSCSRWTSKDRSRDFSTLKKKEILRQLSLWWKTNWANNGYSKTTWSPERKEELLICGFVMVRLMKSTWFPTSDTSTLLPAKWIKLLELIPSRTRILIIGRTRMWAVWMYRPIELLTDNCKYESHFYYVGILTPWLEYGIVIS